MKCEVCQETLPKQTGRGRRRLYHPACKAFSDGLALLRFGVESLPPLSEAAARALGAEVMLVRNSVTAFIDQDARKAYGARLRSRREKLGVSQDDLSEAAGIHARQISRYELGQRQPDEDTSGALDFALWRFSQSKKNTNKTNEVAA